MLALNNGERKSGKMRNGIATSLLPVALYGGWLFAVSKHQSKVISSEKMGKGSLEEASCTLWWMTMCIFGAKILPTSKWNILPEDFHV